MVRIASWLRSRSRPAPTERSSANEPAATALENPRALMAQGNALLDSGDLGAAESCYRQAMALWPDLAEARINLGFVLHDAGRTREALSELVVAVTLAPDSADTQYLLGVVQQQMGDSAGAIPPLRRAAALRPTLAQAHRDLGKALFDTGRLEEAERALRSGMSAVPSSAELPFFLGNVYAESQRYERALECYRSALALRPDMAAVYSNMVPALINTCDFAGAVAAAQAALRLDPSSLHARSNLPMALSRDPDCTPERYLAHAREFGEVVAVLAATAIAGGAKMAVRLRDDPESAIQGPLRVGLVSGDLHRHPVGYFLDRTLVHWDHKRMALVVFANQRGGDDLTARLRSRSDVWHNIEGLDDTVAARVIAAEGIDILVDLSGHTPRNRLPLFARRAAPVQASWLGYWASTGVPAMDHLLADPIGVPDEQRRDFTEHVWHLPETRLCFSPPEDAPPVAPLPALQAGHVTFGSFQSMVKLNNAVLALWARVLKAVPKSRLRLQALQFADDVGRTAMQRRLTEASIDPASVDLALPTPRASYLAAYAQVDMILDTFPHTGGTTTCEALWMGVPTLTLSGRSLLARQGASLLSAAGLMNWTACDEASFEARASALAADLPALDRLRQGLRDRVAASALFDARRFAANLQDALAQMAAAGTAAETRK